MLQSVLLRIVVSESSTCAFPTTHEAVTPIAGDLDVAENHPSPALGQQAVGADREVGASLIFTKSRRAYNRLCARRRKPCLDSNRKAIEDPPA